MTAVVKVTGCDGAAVLTVFKEWDREFKCEGEWECECVHY